MLPETDEVQTVLKLKQRTKFSQSVAINIRKFKLATQ